MSAALLAEPPIWADAPKGARVVRLIYVDEAGLSKAVEEPFVIVGGVIVHADAQLIPLEEALDALVEKWIPEEHREGFVFHAKDLFNGGGKVFDRKDPRWTLERRLELADELAALPVVYGLTLALGMADKALDRRPANVPLAGWMAFNHAVAFLGCALTAEHWMRTACPGEVCMMISEDNDQARSVIREVMRLNQRKGIEHAFNEAFRHLFPIRVIREDPLFQPKRSSSALQLADFWTYVAKRHYLADARYERFWGPMALRLAPGIWPSGEPLVP